MPILNFFLTADIQARASRRHAEYVASGKNVTYEEIVTDIETRDNRDSSIAYAPLRIPVDAIVVDSTGNEVEQTFAVMKKHVEDKLRQKDKN